jgi:hypothetical protein
MERLLELLGGKEAAGASADEETHVLRTLQASVDAGRLSPRQALLLPGLLPLLERCISAAEPAPGLAWCGPATTALECLCGCGRARAGWGVAAASPASAARPSRPSQQLNH